MHVDAYGIVDVYVHLYVYGIVDVYVYVHTYVCVYDIGDSMYALETVCVCDQVSTHVAAVSALALSLSAVTVHGIAQRAQRCPPALPRQRRSAVTGLGAALPW